MIFNWTTDVFEIRPPAEASGVLRYNNGLWTLDDGAWDLAFIAPGKSLAWGVNIPYYANIQWSFLTAHWTEMVNEHPRGGNPWHYVFSEGATFNKNTGLKSRNSLPNVKAYEAAMSRCASLAGCANGNGADFNPTSRFIQEGRLRLRETQELVIPPWDAACCYCGCTLGEAK
jgi:hypothetical protein